MSTQNVMAACSTALVLVLAFSASLAFPQRPMASYNNHMTSSRPSYAPVGFYIVPMHSGGRMGSFAQFGSPYGMQQPQYVLMNPGNFAPQPQPQRQYNPAENRMDVLAQEPPNAQPKPDDSKDSQQYDAETQSISEADPQQSSANVPPGGPMYIVLNQGPQMAYYDLMQQLGANFLQAPSRSGYDGRQNVNFVPFRPASRYRSHEPARRRSQTPLSYAYPNLFTRRQSYDDDSDDDEEGVVIEASQMRRAQQGERVESEKVEAAEPAGPSVAQAKPQAIAMAGPGGVAAATPMATAVVGPGGMAVAAPSATAVAGPSGGKPPVALGGTTNAALTAAYKAQMKAERKQDQFSAVSLGGRLVAPLGTSQSDGKYSSYGIY